MNTTPSPFVDRSLAPDYLEMGGGDSLAVRASTRGRAKAEIAAIQGYDFKDVRVRRAFMRPCDCDGCTTHGPNAEHGYDEFWIYCDKSMPGATEFWVEQT